jgi:excisionase family DNA binding protein
MSMQENEISGPEPIKWLTKPEIARHFKCSVRHINDLMHRRILPYLKIGRFVRFDLAACDQAMKAYHNDSIFA